MAKTFTCQICGQVFPMAGRNQHYCPECAKTVKIQKDHERKQRARQAKPRTSKALTDANAQARAHGMTYGQYVSAVKNGMIREAI